MAPEASAWFCHGTMLESMLVCSHRLLAVTKETRMRLLEMTPEFEPKWVSPPGDTILDILEERGWPQSEFAQRAAYTPKHVSLLVNGKAPITEDTAFRLERVLGGTAQFWLSREAHYREAIAREDERTSLRAQE